MTVAVETALQPIENKSELVADLARGVKPRSAWRIGTEHEKFGYRLDNFHRLDYDGKPSIQAMLQGLQGFGWEPVYENGSIIALTADGASITLEPGGQFELSGAPLVDVHETCAEVHLHLDQVKQVAQQIGAGFLGLGFDPSWSREDIPVMPKARYDIMRRYMPTRGKLGLDMMLRSCTVQVNLDFESEADMVQKFRIALALQPVATALFANSPFVDGKPSGYLSYRSFVWTDTDPDRCGMLPFVFDDGFGFEAWVDYILDVPMYFTYRGGQYHDVAGRSFRDFIAGKLPGLEGERATLKDWEDQLTVAFPEVRLKHFLEMRGADGGSWSGLCALPAFWVGLLYDSVAQDEAYQLIKDWRLEELEALRAETPKRALQTPFRGEKLLAVARRVLDISAAGLKRRNRAGKVDADETCYLEPLQEIAETGVTQAEKLLTLYHGRWKGSVAPIYDEFSY